MSTTSTWTPTSWQGLPIIQQPEYRDHQLLSRTLHKVLFTQISDLPEIVESAEVLRLREELCKCAAGQQLLLQCGDCAESFAECTAVMMEKKMKAMYGFRDILERASGKPVLLVGRIAGQYAKPRSEPTETVLTPTGQPLKVISFRGDNVNCIDIERREPNPKRLLDGYYRSAAVM